MATESFEKLYEKALGAASARAAAGLPVLNWEHTKFAFGRTMGDGGPTVRARGKEFSAFAWREGWSIMHHHTAKILEVDSMPGKSLLEVQAKAEQALLRFESTKASPAKVEAGLKKLGEKLEKITYNRYTVGVPLHDLVEAVKDAGFWVSEDEVPIVSTTKGRDQFPIAFPGSKRELYLNFSWHKMESGRYETVAYAS